MKKSIVCALCIILCFIFSACSDNSNVESVNILETSSQNADESVSDNSETTNENIDVDLTKLSSTMVYSEVYNMLYSPNEYIGKTVKMKGNFSIYTDGTTGKNYYAVIIADATACCQQGLEFEWEGEHAYPQDYPELGTQIEVTGVFDTYREGETTYAYLKTDSGYTVC